VAGRSTRSLERNSIMNTTVAARTSIVMAAVSLLAAAIAASVVWLTLAFPTQKAPPHTPSRLAQIVEQSNTFDELKKWCGHWASLEDRRAELLGWTLDANHQLLSVVIGGALVWGILSGSAFLFIYLLIRRAAQVP
jgi:hypothetical protein